MNQLYLSIKRRYTFLTLIAAIVALMLPLGAMAQEKTEKFSPTVELKVNSLTLPMLVANFGVEVVPLPHFSVNLPAYYTALDWFSETVKFRVLGVQPELRYWLKEDLAGLFFNAHCSFAYYNVALGGDYRYQDHACKTPTFGGGIGIGYKVPLNENETPWGIEFGIGGGVLPLHYDYYYNVHNGRLAGEDTRTYWGVDQAFVSFTYRLGKSKKTEK